MSLSSKENSIRRRKDSLDLQGAGMVSWRAHDWVVAPIAGENNLIFNSDCPACTCSQIERFRGPSTSKFTWLEISCIWLFGGAVKVDGYFETWNFCHTALRLHASEEPGAAPWNIHICQHFKYWVSPPSTYMIIIIVIIHPNFVYDVPITCLLEERLPHGALDQPNWNRTHP